MSREAKILTGIIVVIVGGMIGLFVAFNKPDKSQAPVADAGKVVRSDSYRQGTTDKAVLVEFGDYQCPACGATEPTIERLRQEYGDRISFVFRNFPLTQHQNARPAAEAAEAAGAQGKYWEMHDKLYASQSEWSENGSPTELFVGYAKGLGLDENKFRTALQNSSYESRIHIDEADGTALGVDSTPTFYLNGTKQTTFSYDDLKKALDEALAK